ncbi:tetratricopeptide repeat protein [Marinifilum caeruleilacunae]|uniref:Tetratricopeptide repeat protein n=1 Tax=Marinifilum caeruleilacunae TaxID=2499076 RepID=A0ABX1WT80_9BACT|nr:tetratricopeptide repeat protein [Marinifilum caeruleilacunae]NOU59191.1 tetratricopeptide repeat protein [Marinifilum caeruleilacunae]
MKKVLLLFICMICLLSMEAFAQKERKFIRSGNELFEGEKFENSEVEYRKALDKKVNSYEAGFNLGDALYKQKKYEEALKQFQTLAVNEKDPEKLGHLFHNMGNTLLESKKIDESIEAYKQSLRYNPNSQETKYNLEYARQMKKKQEEEQKKQDQNKDQNQDQKDQDKKDQDKKDQDKKDQDKKDQDKKDQDKKNQDKKDQDQNKDQQDKGDKDKQQQQQPKISKEDAQRLLEALENDEKKVQEKVQKAKAKAMKAKKTKIKKDW